MNIIYQDKRVIAISKPAGIETIQLAEKLSNDIISLHPIHRLDKDTTGVLLLAKNEETKNEIQAQFQNRTIKKIYQTICTGKTPDAFIVEGFIARDPKRKKPFIFSFLPSKTMRGKWRHSKSQFTKIKDLAYKNNPLCQLEAEISTGRTHQIRVHLLNQGFPVLGDKVYHNKNSKKIASFLKAKGQMLHSEKLTFFNSETKQNQTIVAPLPDDFVRILNLLKT